MVGAGVLGADFDGGRGGCGSVCFVGHHSVLGALLLHVGEQGCAHRWQVTRLVPARAGAQGVGRGNGLLFTFCRHGQEVAVTVHDAHPGHALHGGDIDRHQLGAWRAGTHHATMHHAGQAQVLHKGFAARHLGRDVAPLHAGARQAVLGAGLGCGFGGGFALQGGVACHLPIRRLCRAALARADAAVCHLQVAGGHTQLGSRSGQQQATRLSASKAQRRAAVLHRQAACCHALIGGERGVARDDLQALEIDIQLIGNDLRQRRQNALAQLHLAGEHGHRAIGVDAQPAIQAAVAVQAAGQHSGGGRLCNRGQQWAQRKGDGERGTLEKCAARGLIHGRVRRGVDSGVHASSFAARWMARKMRVCVPQRHRLPAMASRICASLGLRTRSSNALADMIMPLMQ